MIYVSARNGCGSPGGSSVGVLSTPSIAAPSTSARHRLTRSGCIRHRHRHNHRRQRGPAARAVAVAFAPALDLIVAATAAVTIGSVVGEAGARISPAIAVSPGVSPGKARGSRRRSRTGKSGTGNQRCGVSSAVRHEVNACGESHCESIVTSKPRFSFFVRAFFSSREPRALSGSIGRVLPTAVGCLA